MVKTVGKPQFLLRIKGELQKLGTIEKRRIIRDFMWTNEPAPLISQSLGLGVFIGFTPTVGVQTILCFVLARLLRRNFLAVFAGTFLPAGTPIQIAFSYFASYRVGCFLLGKPMMSAPDFHNAKFLAMYSRLGEGILLALWTGGIFLGIISGGLTCLILLLLIRIRRKHGAKNQ
jgi:uncharacterized protein (DUF2062 family)